MLLVPTVPAAESDATASTRAATATVTLLREERPSLNGPRRGWCAPRGPSADPVPPLAPSAGSGVRPSRRAPTQVRVEGSGLEQGQESPDADVPVAVEVLQRERHLPVRIGELARAALGIPAELELGECRGEL